MRSSTLALRKFYEAQSVCEAGRYDEALSLYTVVPVRRPTALLRQAGGNSRKAVHARSRLSSSSPGSRVASLLGNSSLGGPLDCRVVEKRLLPKRNADTPCQAPLSHVPGWVLIPAVRYRPSAVFRGKIDQVDKNGADFPP